MSSERSTFLWIAHGETVITQVYNLLVASPWSLTPAPTHKVSEAHHVGLTCKSGYEEVSRCLRLEVGVFSGEFWWLGFSWNGGVRCDLSGFFWGCKWVWSLLNSSTPRRPAWCAHQRVLMTLSHKQPNLSHTHSVQKHRKLPAREWKWIRRFDAHLKQTPDVSQPEMTESISVTRGLSSHVLGDFL